MIERVRLPQRATYADSTSISSLAATLTLDHGETNCGGRGAAIQPSRGEHGVGDMAGAGEPGQQAPSGWERICYGKIGGSRGDYGVASYRETWRRARPSDRDKTACSDRPAGTAWSSTW